MIVSMDYKNSRGNDDIYICLKDEDGNWSAPDNLGPTINTSGFEISPFLSEDGKILFFSSDGHGGYGDADIYMSRRLYDSWGIWSKPINLGNNINSKSFDAYFFLSENKDAYFASNREGGLSDIYTSKILTFENTKEPALLSVNKFKLTETEIQELLGMPISRNIYFEFGSAEVASSSIEMINFLASNLQTKIQYHIELIGHTDKEGTEEFNQKLSENRAEEVAKYFNNHGIDSLRVFTKGVGEIQPIFTNGTDQEMAKNRRVEIYIVK
ncbi:OmpA/MotB [hydrothermal vent metagenome]|uniref:OmpA/MotB n=1 Tax=hydrothermal vent metagenome TaxID=652676 RepID=A0A3B0WSD7_9ZZZZ